MTLHEKIAVALGWTETEAAGFSLAALRNLVRPVDPGLAEEISDVIVRGIHIINLRPRHEDCDCMDCRPWTT